MDYRLRNRATRLPLLEKRGCYAGRTTGIFLIRNGLPTQARLCGVGLNDPVIHMRHEEGAAFAAGAEAHLTGELAVCTGSCGPGNLHLINGLFDCHRSGAPVLAIAAHIPSTKIGIDHFQATHPESLFKECSHYVELVSNPELLPQILTRAMRVAIAKRGVAVVVISGDVALKPVSSKVPGMALSR